MSVQGQIQLAQQLLSSQGQQIQQMQAMQDFARVPTDQLFGMEMAADMGGFADMRNLLRQSGQLQRDAAQATQLAAGVASGSIKSPQGFDVLSDEAVLQQIIKPTKFTPDAARKEAIRRVRGETFTVPGERTVAPGSRPTSPAQKQVFINNINALG